MNKTAFSVAVSPKVPAAERESLLLILEPHATVKEAESRAIEWAVFIAIVKDIGVVAGTAAALIKLANEIITWRKSAKTRGVEPEVKLQHPDKETLNLSTATDEEINEWISKLKS